LVRWLGRLVMCAWCPSAWSASVILLGAGLRVVIHIIIIVNIVGSCRLLSLLLVAAILASKVGSDKICGLVNSFWLFAQYYKIWVADKSWNIPGTSTQLHTGTGTTLECGAWYYTVVVLTTRIRIRVQKNPYPKKVRIRMLQLLLKKMWKSADKTFARENKLLFFFYCKNLF
jgi:hypothetical protein